MKIFLDTSFLISLLLEEDFNHKKARDIAQNLKTRSVEFYINYLVFSECLTILSQRKSKAFALSFGKTVKTQKEIRILEEKEGIQERTWRIFQSVKDKNVSFADCSILASLEEEKISYLATFDKHFQGFTEEFKLKLM